MGILIGGEGIGHEWPGKLVLKDQTLSVFEGDRIGIVGRNGDGKSTLLSILSKSLAPDDGKVTYRRGIAVGVLGQQDALSDDDSVGYAIVGDLPKHEWAASARTRDIIKALVGDLDWDAKVGNLSGGQRRRVDLARLLVGTWDVVCLDEPTNHLDLHTIRWLARHLAQRWPVGAGALLVVTHDRWFLDETCTLMWEVHDGCVEPFEGGYSAYVQQRVERDRQAAVAEERRQNILRKELNWLAHGAKARTSKPRFRIEAAMKLVEQDPPLRNDIELRRLAMTRLGKQVVELRNVGVSYDAGKGEEQNEVLKGISWILGPGERVGILGENGAGKTTLLQVLAGARRPDTGWVKIGKTVRFGMMGQRLEQLDQYDDWRVEELLHRFKRSYRVGDKTQSPEQMLERLGFSRPDLSTYLSDLSGGQRRRLALLCVLMEEPNVLILDEPRSDLDTDMLVAVEDLLDTWPGTLVMVSHDRSLLERVTDNQYALIDGGLTHCPGGVDEYLERLDARSSHAQDRVIQKESSATNGLSNAERRQLKRQFDAVERRLAKLEHEPDRLRSLLEAADPTDYEQLVSRKNDLDNTLQLIDELETEWIELAEKLGLS